MEPSSSYRPKISRETRLLLMAGAAAVALLWVLARIRFDDRPVTPNPVTPVLSQLNAGANYDALASEVADLQGRLLSSLVFVEVARESPTADHSPYRLTGLRWRDDLAIVLLPAGYRVGTRSNLNVRALDPATRLAVVSVPDQTVAFAPTSWTPRRTQQPRYLTASMAARTGVSLRPTFVGSLVPTDGVAWPGMMWAVTVGDRSRAWLLPLHDDWRVRWAGGCGRRRPRGHTRCNRSCRGRSTGERAAQARGNDCRGRAGAYRTGRVADRSPSRRSGYVASPRTDPHRER